MNKPTRRTGVAAAVLATVGVTTVLATGASAFTERDEVLIDRTGYDVAGDGFTNGVPDAPAILEWDHSSTFGTAPELIGYIHFDGVERCARVMLISYDNGVELADGRNYSDEECPGTTDHFARAIEEDGEDGLDAHYGADQVKIVLQTEVSPNQWVSAGGAQTVTFGPSLDEDEVEIRREEFDVGRGSFVNGGPAEKATVEWRAEDNETISANLEATLYANNADDSCVQVVARYKTEDEELLETRFSDEHCLEDDDLHTFALNMGGAFEHYALRQVTYAILKDGEQIGATTVELGDGFIRVPVDLDPITL